MNNLLPFIGSLAASAVALTIAVIGWRKSEAHIQADRDDRMRLEQANKLAELLELHFEAHESGRLNAHDARMKAILLTLTGHLATVLRVRLNLQYTMKDVALDPASAARLRPNEPHDAGHKWLIFDRSSVLTKRSFEPRPEWIEAELAYDIAGLRGEGQEAVLKALSHDVRDARDATVAALQGQTHDA